LLVDGSFLHGKNITKAEGDARLALIETEPDSQGGEPGSNFIALVEVRGVEPLSSSDLLGLLRA
jgi:hypothetical protein